MLSVVSGPGKISFLQFSLLGVVIGILVIGLLGVVRHGGRHDRKATTRALWVELILWIHHPCSVFLQVAIFVTVTPIWIHKSCPVPFWFGSVCFKVWHVFLLRLVCIQVRSNSMDNHFYLRFTAKTFWTCICSRRLCWVANISRVPGWPTSVQKFNVTSKSQRGKSRLWTCLMVLLPSVIALIVLFTYCLSLYCAFPLPPLDSDPELCGP